MFVEPSPVPRFRNEPPAPPPTPPYLNVFVQPPTQDPPASSTSHPPPLPQTALQPFSSPTANTKKPRLVFQSPLHRGQSIPFALHNTLPDDHLIIYKFLTSSNSSRSNQRGQDSHQERYYVRPSSGKISSFHAEIWLILNQTPPIADGASLKDKILVRWAVVQRGTQVEQWAQQQLTENTRRKWLEMLLEAWPDQVLERKTRLSIRFT
ncbi:hypothetical protein DM01DRAFT_252351 [Hesseltinella vesiculosa]|uniref:MSP domain-containing protein n=1 Tax=Hesseltinella vesiculosa TaxID=101127 RepID=A0A1X2GR01_9FUNG|nr:hypothetical protein DM01DRAFT_252351 [Hesseltinella vesiculosa]